MEKVIYFVSLKKTLKSTMLKIDGILLEIIFILKIGNRAF